MQDLETRFDLRLVAGDEPKGRTRLLDGQQCIKLSGLASTPNARS
jgi:hypothetical protein